MLYADDIVLLTDEDDQLQALLNAVDSWCLKWRPEVKLLKTNVLHVRKLNSKRSEYTFKFEGEKVAYCDKYKYLGITINETLNFEQSVNDLCESGGRALANVITKMIKNGGFPLNVY